jgi:hypothetical protein
MWADVHFPVRDVDNDDDYEDDEDLACGNFSAFICRRHNYFLATFKKPLVFNYFSLCTEWIDLCQISITITSTC